MRLISPVQYFAVDSFLPVTTVTTMHITTTPTDPIMPTDEAASQVATFNTVGAGVNCSITTPSPELIQSADDVRNKLVGLGISVKDIADASTWARQLKE